LKTVDKRVHIIQKLQTQTQTNRHIKWLWTRSIDLDLIKNATNENNIIISVTSPTCLLVGIYHQMMNCSHPAW